VGRPPNLCTHEGGYVVRIWVCLSGLMDIYIGLYRGIQLYLDSYIKIAISIAYLYLHTHIYTHTHMHIYIYIYMCVCLHIYSVYMCVSVYIQRRGACLRTCLASAASACRSLRWADRRTCGHEGGCIARLWVCLSIYLDI